MDQPAGNVEHREAENPGDEKNDREPHHMWGLQFEVRATT
jgi:hypothetical protein